MGGATFWTTAAERQGRCKEWSDVNNLGVAVSWTEWQTDGRRQDEEEGGGSKKNKKRRHKKCTEQERRAAGRVSAIKSEEGEAADCVITSETAETEKRDN